MAAGSTSRQRTAVRNTLWAAAPLYGFVMAPTETAAAMVVPPTEAGRCGVSVLCAMSDADTEGSGGAVAWEPDISVTSSESDGPPAMHHNSTDVSREGKRTTVSLEAGDAGDLPPEDPRSLCSTPPPAKEAGPGPELAITLVRLVEEYLGDEALAKDLFLLKHVRRQKGGYISLKLLSGYKRIKKFSRDSEVLAAALRNSEALELNPEGTKVRRRTPLPEALQHEAPPSRTLLVARLPATSATMGGLAALFGQFGSVMSIQVLRPRQDGVLHPEVLSLATRLPDLASATCAVVEYENVWGAARALRELNSPPMSLHVLRRARRHSFNSVRVSPTPSFKSKARVDGGSSSGVLPEELRHRLMGTQSCTWQEHTESSGSEGEESPRWNKGSERWKPQHFTRPSYATHQTPGRWGSSSLPVSPALHRRHNTHTALRAPRGPDGTRGFSKGKL